MMTNVEWNEEDNRRMRYDEETWEVLSKEYKKRWEIISGVVFVSGVIVVIANETTLGIVWAISLIVSLFKYTGAPSSNPYSKLDTNPKYLRKCGEHRLANMYAENSMGIDKVEK